MSEHVIDGERVADPAFHAGDPYPVYQQLRAERPLFWLDTEKCWVVTKHADVVRVSRDPKTFSSRRGILLSDRGRQLGEGNEPILYMDPPEHRRFRKLVQPAFGRGRVAALEPRIRELARELLADLPVGEPLEFVDRFASPFPTLVIAELLGVPGEDRAHFRRWSDAMVEVAGDAQADRASAMLEFQSYLSAAIEERRRSPREDIISDLTRARVDGKLLSDGELVMLILTLLVAGNETTRNLLSNGVHQLCRNPAELERLASDPALVPHAVEEMLRFESSVIGFTRTATRDVELRGQPIAAGERVWMLYGAANRDEDVFGGDSEAFRVARHPNPHVAFGIGEHFCLGAALARLEACVALEEMLARFSRFESAGEPERLPSTVMRSVLALPVVFDS